MTAGAADDALAIAAQVRSGVRRALDVTEETLAVIVSGDGAINSFTSVFSDWARRDRVDAVIAAGKDPGPLAWVPFAVKSLFDVAGEVTVSGSEISRADPPTTTDAVAVAGMVGAGAVAELERRGLAVVAAVGAPA